MTATYTFDVFTTLDGYGAHTGDWGGYWGKQGPELLDRRLALYGEEQRMVFGANTYRAHAQMLASSTEESESRDPWVRPMFLRWSGRFRDLTVSKIADCEPPATATVVIGSQIAIMLNPGLADQR